MSLLCRLKHYHDPDLNSAFSSRLVLKSAVSALSNSCFLHNPLIFCWSCGCLFTIRIIWKYLGKNAADISLTLSLWGLDLILSLISSPSFPPKIAHFLTRSITVNQLEANVRLFLLILMFKREFSIVSLVYSFDSLF